MSPLIEASRTALRELVARHGLRNGRVFGSMARGDDDDTRDVDFLVDVPTGIFGFAMGAMLKSPARRHFTRWSASGCCAKPSSFELNTMKSVQHAAALHTRYILKCIARIHEYVAGDQPRFKNSRLIQDAFVRNLHTMAEASQRLSETTRAGAPEIPWRAISGFRNIIVHDYRGVDSEVIWRVIADELPRLRAALTRLEQGISLPTAPPFSNQ